MDHRRLRDAAVVACIIVVNAAVALSDRMAHLWNHTADSLNVSTDPVAEAVVSTGITTSSGDWAVHSVLWAASGLAAVLLVRRARRVVPVVLLFAVAGLALEALQNVVTSERSTQSLDEVGNLIGLGIGVAVGVLVLRAQALTRAPRT